MNFRHFALALACLAASGCASKTLPLRNTSTLTVVEQNALPTPGSGPLARPYVIGPYDELTITVFGIKDLTDRDLQVDAGGFISFPLAGSIRASGLTPRQIEEEIAGRLVAKHVRNPEVSVNLTKTVSQVVTVDGQVAKPGLYPALGDLTLMKAVAQAEGTTEFAKLEDVVLFRTVGEQRYAALYNLGAVRRGYYEDPEVYAGDIIVVGESRARRMFRDILAAAPLLTAPIIALLQNN